MDLPAFFPEKPVFIQRKLRINAPGDRFEQEADRVCKAALKQKAGGKP